MTVVPVARLSVLIVNYNSWQVCLDAVRSLQANPPRLVDGRPMDYEILIVDNHSPIRDPEAEAQLRGLLSNGRCDGQLIMHSENGGYGKGVNLALGHSSGDAVLVCNPDLVFLPGCVDKLLRYLEQNPTAGAVTPEGFWDRDQEGRLPPNILPTLGDLLALFAASISSRMVRRYSNRRTLEALKVWQATSDVSLPMLSGCCFLMRRSLIDQIGIFDEQFPLYYEDTDLSLRIRRAGYQVIQVYGARLVHLYNRSGQTDSELALERYYISRRLYYRKWYGRLGGWLYNITRSIQETAWAKKRAARFPQKELVNLGSHKGPPVIQFDREYDKVLVEVALDPYFYLAAAMFATGRSWTVGEELFHSFGPTTYFFRVLDISDARPRLLGVYTYTRIAWDAPETEPEAKEARIG